MSASFAAASLAVPTGRQRRIRPALALAFVIFIAVLFRTTALGAIPQGLNPDEALNGNEGLSAHQAGKYPLFYPQNNGREGLFINLIGASEAAFGAGLLALRIPGAIIGSLTVLAVYLLGRELVGWRAAISGSFLLATSFWHVALSRAAFRANLVPLLLTASVFLLVKAFRENDARDRILLALAGGLLYGFGFHSYIAYRISPIVALAFAAADLHHRRRRGQSIRPWATVMAAWWGTAAFVALPIGLYFLQHPTDFSHRMNQLSAFRHAHPFLAIWNGILMAVLQFNVRGDSDWGTNISSAPLLLWPEGLLFLFGLALASWTIARRRTGTASATLLIVWLATMLLPTVLSDDTSAMRSIGDITPVYLLAGCSVAWIYARLGNRWARALLVTAVLTIGATQAYRYFGVWAHSPGTADDLNAQVVRAGWMFNRLPPETPLYMAVDRNDDDYRIDYKNAAGTELALPYTTGIVILETREHRVPIFLFEDEAALTRFPPGSILVQMRPSDRFFQTLEQRGIRLHTEMQDGVPYAVIE